MTTFLDRKLRQEFVTFLEPPATKDEVEIAKLLKSLHDGINTSNLNKLLSVFSENASVESLYLRKVLGVAEYGKAIKTIFPIIQFSFLDQIRIELQDDNSAIVYGILSSRLKNSWKIYQGLYYAECNKINGNWLITSTRHLPPNSPAEQLTSTAPTDS